MASQTKTKLYKVGSKSPKTGVKTYRHSIFLEKAFVEDSLFPFKAGENLVVKIDKDKLVITRPKDWGDNTSLINKFRKSDLFVFNLSHFIGAW
jgi:hypothetical protein